MLAPKLQSRQLLPSKRVPEPQLGRGEGAAHLLRYSQHFAGYAADAVVGAGAGFHEVRLALDWLGSCVEGPDHRRALRRRPPGPQFC
jgi:hypothetical protein